MDEKFLLVVKIQSTQIPTQVQNLMMKVSVLYSKDDVWFRAIIFTKSHIFTVAFGLGSVHSSVAVDDDELSKETDIFEEKTARQAPGERRRTLSSSSG